MYIVVALVVIAVVGIVICAVLHYLWKRHYAIRRFKVSLQFVYSLCYVIVHVQKVDTTNPAERGEEEVWCVGVCPRKYT